MKEVDFLNVLIIVIFVVLSLVTISAGVGILAMIVWLTKDMFKGK